MLIVVLVSSAACTVGQGTDGGGGGSDDSVQPDAPTSARVCALPDSLTDGGDLAALKAQQCNVPGSGGARKWYRLSATLAGSTDVVQLELWDGLGAFAGGAVRTGTFPAETSFDTCGVCIRALGDKGAATQKEYFATAGSVEITALGAAGQPISATITSATLVEIDATSHAAVASGCTASVGRVKVDGTLVAAGGGGGGGGNCPVGVGD